MEYLGLIIIYALLIIARVYYEKNKENKYWKEYYKEQYFKEKQKDCPTEFVDIVNKEFWNLI